MLKPGEIQLHVRNDGPDTVRVRQVIVNDGFAPFTQSDDEHRPARRRRDRRPVPVDRGRGLRGPARSPTPGVTIDHTITAATETPGADLGFYGLMALIGLYVGIIPVAIGMLWLPWLRGVDARWIQFLLAFTIGLLAFLGIEALLEGTDIANTGAQVFGGAALVWLGAAVGVPRARRRRRLAAGPARPRRDSDGIRSGLPGRLLLVAVRDRPPQPRRGARDRLRLRGRLARARRHARRGLRAPQHDRGARDRRAGRARAQRAARPARCCSA